MQEGAERRLIRPTSGTQTEELSETLNLKTANSLPPEQEISSSKVGGVR